VPIRRDEASVVAGRAGALVAANAAADDVLAAGAAPELLRPPVNLLRLAVHPHGMGCRVENLPEWGRHIIENVRAQALRSPDPGSTTSSASWRTTSRR
jgi:hypothetical protein